MANKVLTVSLVLLVFGFSALMAQDAPKVEKLLDEINPWVTTDTTKILAYIDSCNTVTNDMLESSKFWEPTVRDLSFLLGIDYLGSPQIDNTGRNYFMMRLTGESSALFYSDGSMGWPIQLTPNNWANEGFTLSSYTVHPSGDFFLVRVNKFGDEMHDIWHFTRAGQFRPLLESRTERYGGIMFDDNNPDIFYFYIDNKTTMYFARYTISAGKVDTLYTEPGSFYPADYKDGKIIYVRSMSFSSAQLMLYDINTNEVTELSDTLNFWAADFTEDGRIITLTTAKSKDDEFMKFCLLDPDKPKKFKLIFDPKMESEEFAFFGKQGIGVATLNKDGYSELTAFDLDGNMVPVPKMDIGVISEFGTSAITGNDLGDVVFSFTSPVAPPTVYKFRLGETKLEQFGRVSTFGFDFSDITVDVIRYKSEDGWEIPALIYIPASAKKDGTNPAIIDYHGGPPSQSRPYFQRNLAFALSKGFIFMRPNVRGSSGYGPAYEQADNLEKRFEALKDAEHAIDYLIDEGWSSPDRIAIWGASYGGYTVNWLATHCPEKIACVVSDVGVSEIDHDILHSPAVFRDTYEKEYGQVGSKLVRSLSPIFYAENASKPILVTGGFNDPRVPPSDPRRFAYVLNKLGKPVWYYEDVKQGHGSSFKAQLIRDLARNYVFTMNHVMK